MPLFQIKSCRSASVLFAREFGSLKLCVKAAVKARANLTGAYLTGAYLAGANLTGANLTRANLTDAYLTDANLTDANLTGAYLERANLAGANLTDASLTDANLTGANLTDANLTGAKRGEFIISNVGVILAGTPDGWPALGYVDRDSNTLRLEVGCRRLSLGEGRAKWAGKDNRREVLAALDYIAAIAVIRGWSGETAMNGASPHFHRR